MKQKVWYVYEAKWMHSRRYLGRVKAKTGKKAAEIATRRFGKAWDEVIQRKYIADRATGKMRGPKVKS